MIDKNVRCGKSDGADCFVCDRGIAAGEKMIFVVFVVPLLITSTTVQREMHVECAEHLSDLLERRIREAKKK